MLPSIQTSKPIQFGIRLDIEGFESRQEQDIANYLSSHFNTLPDSVNFTVRPDGDDGMRIAVHKDVVSVAYALVRDLYSSSLDERIQETMAKLEQELHQACLDLNFWSRSGKES